MRVRLFITLACWLLANIVIAEDGYRLWLRYDRIANSKILTEYRKLIRTWKVDGDSPTLLAAGNELNLALEGLLGVSRNSDGPGVLACKASSPLLSGWKLLPDVQKNGHEGFVISTATLKSGPAIVIAANTDLGVLYGVFHFLRLVQMQSDLSNVFVSSAPKVKRRILNHWDNLDRTVERGYAGASLWDWHKLPEYLDPRYTDYARANASIGINGTVLTNVNANALVLTEPYLIKAAALASVFRPYGIRVYLTARFNAPMELGGLKTADPLNEDVKKWWVEKTNEIYKIIPDFGGFLVKANSEGQPGPQNFGRTQADGANVLADALTPHGGIVIWRAFVYDDKNPDDRAKQAFTEFKPLDGKFRSNALVQVKNGPIDFQPREPFHPLFGAMPRTPLMVEFQITQEYLGFSTHLVYLSSLFKECLDSDTYSNGPGSTVARVVDGTLDHHTISGMAGVANIGTDRNWCGHPFAQANWYAFGRLAWDHQLSSETIADEWIRSTFSNDPSIINSLKAMMVSSRETCVNYMTPLGLHHIMGYNHHYGPGPWVNNKQRADWTAVYYHKADSTGIGFDRTSTGSNAVSQYAPPVRDRFESLNGCPEKYLLWFHHVNWDYRLHSGETLWDGLCHAYYRGADSVRWMQKTWESVKEGIDAERFNQVKMLLDIQQKESILWRNSCVLYFQTFSKRPLPAGLEAPDHSLDYYIKLEFPYAPGIRPRW